MTTRVMMKFVLFAFLCLIFTSPAWSQLTTAGAINGTVTDSSGAVVPGAAITITSEATQQETSTQSNGDGSFAVSALTPGRYKITVTKDQFQTYTETGINLNAAQTVTVRAALTVGQTTATVTVQASAVQVQTTTPEVSSLVNEQQVSTLPLNGRNYQSLSFLMPGVTNTAPDTAQNQGGFLTSNVISVNGGGTQGTVYYLDGAWNSNVGNDKNTRIVPNPDAIQEVRLLQNNYGAQYTLNGATAMLVETKSGTSTFHGTVFEYFRNNVLDARNYFSPVVSPLKQNIYGFTVGGPIFIPDHYNTKKDKTFFFWSEQWVNQDIGNVLRAPSPTAAQRMGTFNTPIKDPLTGLPFPQTSPGVYQIPANRIQAGSVSLLNVTVPLPNAGSGFLNYVNTTPTINKTRIDDVKVDQIISPKLRLMGEYMGEPAINGNSTQSLGGSPYSTTRQPIGSNDQIGQIRLTQLISPSMVNTTSISAGIHVVNIEATGITQQSQIPGLNEVLPFPIEPRGSLPADRLPFIEFGGGYPILGLVYILPVFHASEGEYSFSDDWSWLHGKHYIQAGVQYVRGTVYMTSFAATGGIWVFTGQFTGNAMADFLLGDAAALQQLNQEFRGHQNWPLFSPYIQDQWKATSKLTITAGFRYSYNPNPSFTGAQSSEYSNFVPSLYNPAQAPIVTLSGTITPTPNYNPTNGIAFLGTPQAPKNLTDKYKNYWNPTAGFAWDPFGDGKTSIRGGYGISHYLVLEGSCQYECLNNPPSISTTTLVSPSWPNSTGGQPAPTTALVFQGQLPSLRAPIIQTYSLGVQRQFGEWFASVTGAGSITNHQPIQTDINQPVPEGGFNFNPLINTGVSRYATSLAGPAPFQGYGQLDMFQGIGFSNWNALEVSVKHPVGHDVFFSAAYTWQHGLSTNRSINGFYNGSNGIQDAYHPGENYGTSNSNVGQILSISTIWNIPLFRKSTGLKRTLLGGWSYSDVTTLQSGFALDPGLTSFKAGQTPGLATRANRVPGISVGGPKTVAEWFNKAAFSGPAVGFFGDAATGVKDWFL